MSIDRSAPSAAADPRSGSAQPGRATPYRMTVTTRHSHTDVVALADQCLAAWLKEEGHAEPPPAPPDPADPLPPRSPIAVRHRLGERVLLDRDDGPLGPPHLLHPPDTPAGRYTRRRLRTPAPHGTHQLTLTVATEPDGPSWVRLEAEHLATTPGLRSPCAVPVPELVHQLLPLLDAMDGSIEVRARPRLIGAAEVDEVIDELCDPARRLPIVVASVPADLDPHRWSAEPLEPLLHKVSGLAVGYVLDHGARVVFNTALEYHTVYGGAVRTYLPEVDPASRRDAARHLVLPRHRIEDEPRRAAALLAREPRRLADQSPLPEPLAGVPVLRLRPESSPATEPSPARELSPAVEAPRPRLLYHKLRREPHLRAESEPQGAAVRRSRGVSGRFCPPGDGGPDPVGLRDRGPRSPCSFTELLHRIDEFPLLSFTGDEKETIALDAHAAGAYGWARLTWDGLTALQQYAAVAVRGVAGGDFKQWCEHAPVGVSQFPPRKAVRNESRTVCSHSKMRRERMFAVPSSVDPSGRAFMGAHLRIGGGRTAPRLHYLDDCSGSGRIYVGYIGIHLTNTMTN
ncbi:hypothetical protein [Kitasatospora sp. LaBMicrA B282]|uniref:hypothetical protein n=1 Tax=Kitasatospora sp. LaBMicrA B282 TaxID=3420949 RepID=UPI003D0BEBD1